MNNPPLSYIYIYQNREKQGKTGGVLVAVAVAGAIGMPPFLLLEDKGWYI